MNRKRWKNYRQKKQFELTSIYILAIYSLIGIMIFYFILHPIIMTTNWFETNEIEINLNTVIKELFENFKMAFMPEMFGMASVFILLGALTGIGFGIFSIKLKRKSKTISYQQNRIKEDLISIINFGENVQMEFKSSLRYDYINNCVNIDLESVILKTIAGFLNATGGRIVIGIDDDGHVLGLKNDYNSIKKKNKDGFELKIFQLIANSIGHEFCHLVNVSTHEIEGKEICVLEMTKSKSPVYVTKNSKITFFVRIGNATKPLSVKETVNYLNR